MAEIQAFLVELVGSFEFELTPDAQQEGIGWRHVPCDRRPVGEEGTAAAPDSNCIAGSGLTVRPADGRIAM